MVIQHIIQGKTECQMSETVRNWGCRAEFCQKCSQLCLIIGVYERGQILFLKLIQLFLKYLPCKVKTLKLSF